MALAIAQLLIYNAVNKKPTKPVTNIRHIVERETPIAIYIALKVYGATEHCEKTINRLHELGICISYARVRDISKVMANSVVKMFEAEGVPCGPTLRNGLLTIGSADNIDLNPTNRDAKDALHGTGCALTQLPTSTNAGTVRSVEQYREAARALSNIAQLPRFYTEIKEVEVINESLIVPAMSDSCRPTAFICNSSLLSTSDLPELMLQTSIDLPSTGDATLFLSEEDWITHTQSITEWDHLSNDDTVSWEAFCATASTCNSSPLLTSDWPELMPQIATDLPSTGHTSSVEEDWITHAQSIIERDHLNHDDTVSWAAFCASNQPPLNRLPCITSTLPIFRNKASTSPMIYHAMSTIKSATETLNPGQTPVITLDQPLYAIAKAIQWSPRTDFNEDNYCVFLGPLHSEMLLLKLLGDWLRDSGWIAILIDAEVTTPGRAEAMLKGSHVTRTCYVMYIK